jgi:holliday junction DNA helicase RuvA
MIGFLSGIVIVRRHNYIIINVNNVGYQVNVKNPSNFQIQQSINLFIHTHVREEEITLYGFETEAELDYFHLLTSVSGVGPKIALAILSVADVPRLNQAISSSQVEFFTTITGVGRKTAQKIILELKPKLGKGQANLNDLETNKPLTQALEQLSFTKEEILAVINSVDSQAPLALQIKQALKIIR